MRRLAQFTGTLALARLNYAHGFIFVGALLAELFILLAVMLSVQPAEYESGLMNAAIYAARVFWVLLVLALFFLLGATA